MSESKTPVTPIPTPQSPPGMRPSSPKGGLSMPNRTMSLSSAAAALSQTTPATFQSPSATTPPILLGAKSMTHLRRATVADPKFAVSPLVTISGVRSPDRRASVGGVLSVPPSPERKRALSAIKDISTSNCFELLKLAKRVQNTVLLQSTTEFITSNLSAATCVDFLAQSISGGFDDIRVLAARACAASLPEIASTLIERPDVFGPPILTEIFSSAVEHSPPVEAAKLRIIDAYSSGHGAESVAALWHLVGWDDVDDTVIEALKLSDRIPADVRKEVKSASKTRTIRHLAVQVERLTEVLEEVTADHKRLEAEMIAKLESVQLRLEAIEQRVAPFTTTFAGSISGDAEGVGDTAAFSNPMGIAIGPDGTIFVADCSNHKIRCIAQDGTVRTLAGGPRLGYADGTRDAALFYSPSDVAVDSAGNVFVADYNNHRIRRVTPDGVVTTLAGSGSPAFADGKATAASFHYPTGVAVDATGNVFVADFRNHRIRRICKKGKVKTIAGTGSAGFADGPGITASFNGPWKIAVDRATGALLVADMNNNRVRRISPSGVVSTLAGNGVASSVDGFRTDACLNAPVDVDVDVWGNVFVAEYGGHRIRKIHPQGSVSTIAGLGTQGLVEGPNALFSFPYGVVSDNHGSLFVADYGNHRIRQIQPV